MVAISKYEWIGQDRLEMCKYTCVPCFSYECEKLLLRIIRSFLSSDNIFFSVAFPIE